MGQFLKSVGNQLAGKAAGSAVSAATRFLFGDKKSAESSPGSAGWLSKLYTNLVSPANGFKYGRKHLWIVNMSGLPQSFLGETFGGTTGNAAPVDQEGYTDLTYLASSVTTPSVSTSVNKIKTGINRSSHRVTSGTEFSDFSISFYDDSAGRLYQLFYALVSQNHQGLNQSSRSTKVTGLPKDQDGKATTKNHYDTLLSVDISRLSNNHNLSHHMICSNIVPINISGLELDYNNAELSRFTVTFSVELVSMSHPEPKFVGPQNQDGPDLGLLGGILGGAQNLVSDVVGGTIGGVGGFLGFEGAGVIGDVIGDQVADTLGREATKYAKNEINDLFAEIGAKNPILGRNSKALAGLANSGLFGNADASDYRNYGIGGDQSGGGGIFGGLFDRSSSNSSENLENKTAEDSGFFGNFFSGSESKSKNTFENKTAEDIGSAWAYDNNKPEPSSRVDGQWYQSTRPEAEARRRQAAENLKKIREAEWSNPSLDAEVARQQQDERVRQVYESPQSRYNVYQLEDLDQKSEADAWASSQQQFR